MKCRAYELKKGFTVEMYGRRLLVTEVSEKGIFIGSIYRTREFHFGKNCQMWIKLISMIPPVYSNRKPFKKVTQYDLNGCELETYESIVEASKKTGCSTSAISDCLNGRIKTSKSFIWKFANP